MNMGDFFVLRMSRICLILLLPPGVDFKVSSLSVEKLLLCDFSPSRRQLRLCSGPSPPRRVGGVFWTLGLAPKIAPYGSSFFPSTLNGIDLSERVLSFPLPNWRCTAPPNQKNVF